MKLLANILKSHVFGYGHKQRLMVLGITLASVLIAMGLGRLLDKLLGQNAVFTLIFVIISFPITQGLIYRAFRKQGEKK